MILGRDVFGLPVVDGWARTLMWDSAPVSAASPIVLLVLTWMDGDSGDTARRRRPHSFTANPLTRCWPRHTEWHQLNQSPWEPHGNGCCGGHTTAGFESPVGGNDIIQTRLLQEAVFTVHLQTRRGSPSRPGVAIELISHFSQRNPLTVKRVSVE